MCGVLEAISRKSNRQSNQQVKYDEISTKGGDVIKYVGVPKPLCLGLGVFPDCGSLECANNTSCNKTLQPPGGLE